jgi:hypothetical protein
MPSLAQPSMEQKANQFKLYRDNAWQGWLDIVFTEDPSRPLSGPQKAPPYDYLFTLYQIWLRRRLLAVYKSRRMMMSWFFIWLHLQIAMFNQNRTVFLVSKKEENSDELVKRCEFIYDHIPKELLPFKPKKYSKYCLLGFPELRSRIVGVPEGSDQLRQFASSAVFFDEYAFWRNQEKAFAAAMPTVEQTGRFTIVSTVQPGYYYEFCTDRTDLIGTKIGD